jgi:hypothetical protein
MYWPGRGKDGRGETENKEETLKIKMELMGNRRLLIFLRRREKCMVLYGRKINGKPTGGCGSLEIPAVNADGGCNQHEAMRNHGVSFF